MNPKNRLRTAVTVLTLLLSAALCGGAVFVCLTGYAARRADPAAAIYTAARIRQGLLPAGLLFLPWLAAALAAGLRARARSGGGSARPGKRLRPSGRKAAEPAAAPPVRDAAPSVRDAVSAAVDAAAAGEGKPLRLLRLGLLLAAAVMLLMGVQNGGMRDVLYKAIRICTECIGLG